MDDIYTYSDFIAEWKDGNDFIRCRTSGSTGTPKIIELPKSHVAESARRTISFFSLGCRSHLHSCISPEFIGGKMMAVRSEICGGTLTWETPTNRPLDNYNGGAIDLLAVVPSQMIHLLDNMNKMPEIRHVIIGGAKIGDSLRARIADSGLDAWETYGMTETASHIALRKVGKDSTSFMPLPGVDVSVDSSGRLIIEIEGWQTLTTNDIAEIKSDGSFEIKGRADNVINTGGKKVHPEQVEAKLEQLLGFEVLITSERDDKWGQRVIMVIDDSGSSLDNTVILEICRANLAKECVPKRVIHAKIEHTPNGKKKRNNPCHIR